MAGRQSVVSTCTAANCGYLECNQLQLVDNPGRYIKRHLSVQGMQDLSNQKNFRAFSRMSMLRADIAPCAWSTRSGWAGLAGHSSTQGCRVKDADSFAGLSLRFNIKKATLRSRSR
jgi:hypothetical protein